MRNCKNCNHFSSNPADYCDEHRSLLGKSEPLLPCPFCGQMAYAYAIEVHEHVHCEMPDYEGGWFVECTVCSAGISARTEEMVIDSWNKRTNNGAKDE